MDAHLYAAMHHRLLEQLDAQRSAAPLVLEGSAPVGMPLAPAVTEQVQAPQEPRSPKAPGR